MKNKDFYVAEVRVCVKTKDWNITEVSEVLGRFLVRPTYGFTLDNISIHGVLSFREINGYKEIITNQKVAKNKYRFLNSEDNNEDLFLLDNKAEYNQRPKVGDLCWTVLDKDSYSITEEIYNSYLGQSKEEVKEQLNSIYEKSKKYELMTKKINKPKIRQLGKIN